MFNHAAGLGRYLSGIKVRLIGVILVAVTPLIVAPAIGLYEQHKAAIEAAGHRAQDFARRGADIYRELTFEAHTLLQIIANVPELVNRSAESCAAFLEDAGKDRAWANGFWVFDRDGNAICTTVPNGLGYNMSDRAYFQEALKTRSFVVSDFFISKVRHLPVAVAAYPVLDRNGEVSHVLGITLRMSWFHRFIGELSRSADATAWLVDGAGNLMARSPQRPDLVGKNFRDMPLVKTILSRKQGWSDLAAEDGPPGIYGYVQVPGTTARLAVGFDRAVVLEGVNAQLARSAFVVIVALAIALLTGFAIARTIARPLITLTGGLERARFSDDTRLPEVSGYAEVESLAQSLSDLLSERRRREQALTSARADAERATEEARAAMARLRDAIEAVPAGITFLDAEDRFVLWNNRYTEMYADAGVVVKQGMTFEERLRKGMALGMFPDAVGREEAWLADRMKIHRSEHSIHEQRLMNDRWLHIEERRTSDGGSIGIRIDVTDAKRREQSFRFLFESNPVPMWVFDRETLRFLAVNDAAVACYGYTREQFLSMTTLDIRDPVDHDALRAAAADDAPLYGDQVWRHRKADGSEIQVAIYSRAIIHEGRPAKITAPIDITEQRRSEARIRHLAHFDSLTDLANRTLFRERLEQALARRRHAAEGIALLCIDLDRFKDINDTLGHPTGDQLLRYVAKRLLHNVREQDTVARIGGDEFAVVQDGVIDPVDANALALRLIDALSAPYDIDGHEVLVTPSVGIATTLSDGGSADELLNHADLALYRAKSLGRRSHCFFAPEMDTEIKARRALETDLRSAFINKEFDLHYQPLVDLASGEPSGFEALLRWKHPERGMVSPAEFIPIAEEIGLVVPLGEWVLRTGCAEAVKWPAHITIAINLSPLQFRSGNLVETVRSALEQSGLSPHRLELEITETVLLEDNDVNHAVLHQLQSLGVRIAMDDFGTGYSSLSYLRRFPFNKIKIDGSFVRELPDSLDCMTITRGIVDLATGLGMTTTAEGLETPEQLYVLRTYGCTQGQGYLFSRAVPANEVAALLAAGAANICRAAA
jgi:diguanylate cyclase (GGDEF)-like protein/PAS domain S-box-containing protein